VVCVWSVTSVLANTIRKSGSVEADNFRPAVLLSKDEVRPMQLVLWRLAVRSAVCLDRMSKFHTVCSNLDVRISKLRCGRCEMKLSHLRCDCSSLVDGNSFCRRSPVPLYLVLEGETQNSGQTIFFPKHWCPTTKLFGFMPQKTVSLRSLRSSDLPIKCLLFKDFYFLLLPLILVRTQITISSEEKEVNL
jgi:hypothetical protein